MQPPTEEQIELAQGAIPVNDAAAKEYLGKVEVVTSNIIKSLEHQARKVQGDFDQAVFDTLLAEWMVASKRSPGRKAIRSRVMKMGEDAVEGTHKMFEELESKVSLSCDAWTSSSQHPFLAIVAHDH
ncbi:hypothetical protein K438DRAFT_1955705 [Mycena galopus ATCC 62051]|nr:hypothetical protein K438DRAFT_1955705 [Mycena galopus ATCC 62051]